MSRIHLTSDSSLVDAPRGAGALWVYGNKATRPNAERAVTIKQLLDDTKAYMTGIRWVVAVGLVSDITTPSNRVKTGQVLTDPLPGVERISIDEKLFITDPWRMWWHFGCAGVWFGGFNVSYTLEGRWNQYVEGATENPCAPDEVAKYGDGVISARAPFRFDSIDIDVVEIDSATKRAYLAEKAAAFDEEHTVNSIITRLSGFAQTALPCRSVPTYRSMFDSRILTVKATDLGVDQFIVKGIRERADLTNFIADHFRGAL